MQPDAETLTFSSLIYESSSALPISPPKYSAPPAELSADTEIPLIVRELLVLSEKYVPISPPKICLSEDVLLTLISAASVSLLFIVIFPLFSSFPKSPPEFSLLRVQLTAYLEISKLFSASELL